MGNMCFEYALQAIKAGRKVSRSIWNEKGIFIYLQKVTIITKEMGKNMILAEMEGEIKITAHIDMKLEDNSIMCGWCPSQNDMLCKDWGVLDGQY